MSAPLGSTDLTAGALGKEESQAAPAVIHSVIEIAAENDGRKRVRRWKAKTGCGLDLVIERPSADTVPLISLGLTGWYSETTCGPCLVRGRRKDR